MTNEKGLFAQAGLRNVRSSTIERKIMSTKTSFKRVSAVTALALAIGGLTSVAANAALVASTVTSINLVGSSANTNVTGSTVAVNVGAVIPSQTLVVGDNIRFTGVLTSYPAGGYTSVAAKSGLNGNTAVNVAGSIPTLPTGLATATTVTTTSSLNLVASATTAGSTVTATSTTSGFGSFTFAPTVVGTYAVTVYADGALNATANGVIDAGEPQQTITIVVAAGPTLSSGTSTAFMIGGNAGTTAGSATSDAIPVTASKTMSGANVGGITVSLFDSSNVAVTSGASLTASITGPGYLSWLTADLPTANSCSATPTYSATVGRSITAQTADAVGNLIVCADGVAGASTISISIVNSSGVTTPLASKSVTFYGSVTKLAVSKTNFTIGKAGSANGNGTTGARTLAHEVGSTAGVTPQSAGVTTPAFIVAATDSSGNPVNTAVAPTVVSSDPTVVSAGACVLDVVSAAAADAAFADSLNGVGFYNCNFTGAANAASGSKATLTIKVLDPADAAGLAFLTTTIAVSIGGSVAKEVLSTDKASYAPGEAMTINVTATDSKGNPVFDGAAAVGAITPSKSLGGTAFAPALYVGGKASSKSSTGVVSTFAPAVQGPFTLTATGTDAATTALTASATVTDGSTTSAQIASLITKINALAALIAKIQKKLGVK